MPKLKTKITDEDVIGYIESIEDESKKEDACALVELFEKVTKKEPRLWNNNVIGFGTYHYKSERSSQEGEWYVTGFAVRKQNISIYIIPGFDDFEELLSKIGKYTNSKGCLYIKKLEDVDVSILEELIGESVEKMRGLYRVD